MDKRNLYKIVFTEYPDVVDVDGMCQMLGGISPKMAYKLIKEKKVEAFKIGKEYRIPKINLLIYLNITEEKIKAMNLS